MKKDIHSKDYRPVVFEDLNNGVRVMTQSTIKTDDKTKWEDGNEYPLVKVHISASSHPFFTGQEKLVDIEGRVDRFQARRDAAAKALEAKLAANAKADGKPVVKAKTKKEEVVTPEVVKTEE
jgi:large subunit ribosomal protein L31